MDDCCHDLSDLDLSYIKVQKKLEKYFWCGICNSKRNKKFAIDFTIPITYLGLIKQIN